MILGHLSRRGNTRILPSREKMPHFHVSLRALIASRRPTPSSLNKTAFQVVKSDFIGPAYRASVTEGRYIQSFYLRETCHTFMFPCGRLSLADSKRVNFQLQQKCLVASRMNINKLFSSWFEGICLVQEMQAQFLLAHTHTSMFLCARWSLAASRRLCPKRSNPLRVASTTKCGGRGAQLCPHLTLRSFMNSEIPICCSNWGISRKYCFRPTTLL